MSTHIAKRRNAAAEVQARVMELLGWDDQTYCNHKYNTGLNYLAYLLPGDKYMQDQISRSRTFWNWWKVQWTLREETMLAHYNEMFHPLTVLYMYANIHDAYNLVHGQNQYRLSMDETYAVIIKKMQHENKNKPA